MKPHSNRAADVWDSPAWPLLLRLEADGFTFKLDGSRVLVHPLERLAPTDRAQLKTHREAVRTLLMIALDDEVQQRLVVFKEQCRHAAAGTLPAFVFKSETAYLKGVCFSCGVPLPELRFGRCWPCSVAWRMAAGVPIPMSSGAAIDEARIA